SRQNKAMCLLVQFSNSVAQSICFYRKSQKCGTSPFLFCQWDPYRVAPKNLLLSAKFSRYSFKSSHKFTESEFNKYWNQHLGTQPKGAYHTRLQNLSISKSFVTKCLSNFS